MKSLDKSKPFGQVLGGGEVAFVQDGVEFDVQGKAVSAAAPAGESSAPAVLEATLPAGKAPAAAPARRGRPPKQIVDDPVSAPPPVPSALVDPTEDQLTKQLLD